MGDNESKKRARLIDVAERAGVTKSIASRVLSGDRTLSTRPETRERVLDAARDLGYRPHGGAQALANARSATLALLVPDLANPTNAGFVRGAVRRAHESGYVVVLLEDTVDQPAAADAMALVEAGRVDGLIIGSARRDHLVTAAIDVPHVFINRAVPGAARNVTMDDEAASMTAVDHLIGKGHLHIGHVAGPSNLETAQARLRGFRTAARQHPDARLVSSAGDFSEAGGAAAVRRLLGRHPDLTAVYVSTLHQTVGVLRALREMKVTVPADLSVISYDDIALADYLEPPITTIAMPLYELGECAVDAVVDQLTGGAPHDVIVPTQPRVVERCSVARLG